MNFSLHDLKFAIYAMFGLLGLGGVTVAYFLDRATLAAEDPTYHLSALILLIVGGASIFFCVETILLRGEDDIWQ